MVNFKVESWAAIAPGIKSEEDWIAWFDNPSAFEDQLGKVSLKQFPPMLRRRFNELGKCAMASVLDIAEDEQQLPSVFASRHGDAKLTLSLLQGIASDEPMSPTGFSLAVHNAVSGLYSIARKETCPTTSIAAMQGLILQALFEAAGQLEESERVLCVVYDLPLPEPLSHYQEHPHFPYSIAMILSRSKGASYQMTETNAQQENHLSDQLNSDVLNFIALLSGTISHMMIQLNSNNWLISRKDTR